MSPISLNYGWPKDFLKDLVCVCGLGPNGKIKTCSMHSWFPWKVMNDVGLLSHLEVIKLEEQVLKDPEWSPNEGQFVRLKFLLVKSYHLVHWAADSTHFPGLWAPCSSTCGQLSWNTVMILLSFQQRQQRRNKKAWGTRVFTLEFGAHRGWKN